MTSSLRGLSIVGTVLLVLGVSSAFAQAARAGQRGSPMSDVKSETTIKGTVESVEPITASGSRGRRGLGGTHLVVKTEKETLDIHLGPTAYLAEQKIVIAKGDALEILGSRISIDDEPVLLARQIKKGEATWTLRDASGRPFWSGGRRQ